MAPGAWFRPTSACSSDAYMALKERIMPRKLAVSELQAELTRAGVKINQAAFGVKRNA